MTVGVRLGWRVRGTEDFDKTRTRRDILSIKVIQSSIKDKKQTNKKTCREIAESTLTYYREGASAPKRTLGEIQHLKKEGKGPGLAPYIRETKSYEESPVLKNVEGCLRENIEYSSVRC